MSTSLGTVDRRKLGSDEGAGPILSGGSLESASDGNLEVEGP